MKMALAIIFPPLGVLACGRFGQFLLNIFFCIIGVWVGGIIHAVYIVMKHDADERHREMLAAMQGSAPVQAPAQLPGQPGPSHGVKTDSPKGKGCLIAVAVVAGLSVLLAVVGTFIPEPAERSQPEKPGVERKSAQKLYTIISDKPTGTIKRAVEVRLQEKVSEEALEGIAKEIRASNPKKFERTFILYYLPGQALDAGAWATSHFNPALEVVILGIPADTGALAADAVKGAEQEVGRWEYHAPPGFIAILVSTDAGILLRRVFGDGSSMDERVSASPKGNDIILSPVQKNDAGDYWILDSEGDFRLMDKDGFIGKATMIGKRKGVAQLKAGLGIDTGGSKGGAPAPTAATIFDSRTWTSADGQQTFSGRLTEMGDGQLTVEKDGEEITFPMEKLSDADRRFLGQGVTITTVEGTTHENGSVVRISADAILFKKSSGPVSIPMESLPEKMRQHFAYDPEKAAEARKTREQQAAATRDANRAENPREATGGPGIRKDAERLYMELREMRHNPEFHRKGFGEGGPFRQWYIELEALKKKAPADPELLKLDLFVGELYTLAREWMKNEGRETEASRFFSTRWDRACGIESN